MSGAFKTRAGQKAFERDVREHRVSGLLARRRYGKTTIAGRISLYKMMKTPGHTVVFGSVKVDLGRDMIREESRQLQLAFRVLAQDSKLTLADRNGKELPATLSADDFAELYEATRLEFRLWHSNSIYSRTLIVALTPDAVGLGGDLILDEVGRARRFAEVLEAVMPIIQDQPEYRCIYTTTPPPDDNHPSFALLAPPIGAELPVRPEGNTYKSELGVFVRRITVHDAAADGIPLYDDDTGAPITPEESRRMAYDKDAWDRNYDCKFILGGTSVCGLQELDNAQRKGVGKSFLEIVQDDLTFDAACARLTALLGEGRIGCGWDLASTEKETSNPSSFTVMEEVGQELVTRGVFVWKSSNPAEQIERVVKILRAIEARKSGGRARRVAVDATGDRLFARMAATAISQQAGVPVELIVSSETVELPGYDTPVTKKTWLGDLYVAALNDNRHTFPPERYFREDHRIPKKVRGLYVAEPTSNGMHADTFDSGKLAQHALQSAQGALTAETLGQIRLGNNHGGFHRPQFQPRRLG
ncbi:hypothetical protein CfE428DRAFT_5807 [Chthoniobacter flavus Ellin428]|uniref:Uncharacterized protein n=1 Tax=Chthoniobacter flavus Ellin428 TaxID=497964 RepID=B4DA67_9BACT|nr:hypothetical protein [Chthoniobacter flavus]EDY16694.1 hypothetical protein CfE428DRAFT_5807 [Chthoniobacter flavus Ellin428]